MCVCSTDTPQFVIGTSCLGAFCIGGILFWGAFVLGVFLTRGLIFRLFLFWGFLPGAFDLEPTKDIAEAQASTETLFY